MEEAAADESARGKRVIRRAAAPRRSWAQRAQLEALLGHADEARAARAGRATPRRDDGDVYLLARELAAQAGMADAAETLRATADREPGNFAVQFLMGNLCLDGYFENLGKETDAVGCYSACIALRPDFHFAYANRGLAYLRSDLFEQAEADCTRAIALRPDQAEYYLLRREARRTAALSRRSWKTSIRRKASARRPFCSTICGRGSTRGWERRGCPPRLGPRAAADAGRRRESGGARPGP